MPQAIQRVLICIGCYEQLRGEWIKSELYNFLVSSNNQVLQSVFSLSKTAKLTISGVWIVSYVGQSSTLGVQKQKIYTLYTNPCCTPTLNFLFCSATCVFLIHLHAGYHIPQSLEEQARLQRNTLNLSMDSPTSFGDGVEKMMTSTTGTCIMCNHYC